MNFWQYVGRQNVLTIFDTNFKVGRIGKSYFFSISFATSVLGPNSKASCFALSANISSNFLLFSAESAGLFGFVVSEQDPAIFRRMRQALILLSATKFAKYSQKIPNLQDSQLSKKTEIPKDHIQSYQLWD